MSDTAAILNASIEKWAAYMAHVAPEKGEDCWQCLGAPLPEAGCETGTALYADYRLVRIEPAAITQTDQ